MGILSEIPYGQLTTYGDIAREVEARRGGRRTSALAVGGAVGHNPISIIVPCHRVVGADGSLTGYAGGLLRQARATRAGRRRHERAVHADEGHGAVGFERKAGRFT